MTGLPDDDPDDDVPAAAAPTAAPAEVALAVPAALAGARADKALAALAPPGLSRSRIRALIEGGAAARDGVQVRDPRARVKAGEAWTLSPPPPAPARPAPQNIPLAVVHEDAALIVIDKPAGMAVHPAPGTPDGTLVNALLHRCADSLSGVGGEARPGIVHRIDKETSGLLVVAKTDAAHQALSAQFADHSAARSYLAVAWGAPDRGDPRLMGLPGVSAEEGGVIVIDAPLARHPADRKRMAVRAGGRRAVTRLRTRRRAGPADRPVASVIECRLETGRTHQIRVHCAHVGHPLVGDPVYGRGRGLSADLDPALSAALSGFRRQALHAATLGFAHPDGGWLSFESPPPADLAALIAAVDAAGDAAG